MTTPTERVSISERYRWLEKVREQQARQERVRKLRAELQAAREAGKRIRHERRLARTQNGGRQ